MGHLKFCGLNAFEQLSFYFHVSGWFAFYDKNWFVLPGSRRDFGGGDQGEGGRTGTNPKEMGVPGLPLPDSFMTFWSIFQREASKKIVLGAIKKIHGNSHQKIGEAPNLASGKSERKNEEIWSAFV